jgi:hypothetical protein
MPIAPFGLLNRGLMSRRTGLYTPMYEWTGTIAEFRHLLDAWMDVVADHIWPKWDGGHWVGDAAAHMEDETRRELELAVDSFHRGNEGLGTLAESPVVAAAPDLKLQPHLWHYEIEDAVVRDVKYKYLPATEKKSFDYLASSTIGSNYLDYHPRDSGFDIAWFEKMFWGRMRGLQPPIWDIKEVFQRPRPWMIATALGVEDFRWVTGDGITHTGIHPSITSGHCIQGVLGGCSVFEAMLERSHETGKGLSMHDLSALKQYMVDWGDRRVFAGVHYMTDNIASWVLARRLIPHLFRNPVQVEAFAVDAIVRHSRVFDEIVLQFDQKSTARALLKREFPEGKWPAAEEKAEPAA